MNERPQGFADAWSVPGVVEFYRNHRNKVEELYPSERRFMAEALAGADSVLDVGCAAGGFAAVARSYSPGIRYTGADISPAMIAEARARFPAEDFRRCNEDALPFPDESFDVCVCLGVLHMNLSWKRLLAEAWRVCRRAFLFDLRLIDGPGACDPENSFQRLAFGCLGNEMATVPYVIAGLEEAAAVLAALEPACAALKSFGYMHPVSEMTISPIREVCMAAFLLGKGDGPREVGWGLPMARPSSLFAEPSST